MGPTGKPAGERAAVQPLGAAVREDFRGSSGWQRVSLVGVVFWVAYEWGAGNEALTPWILARVIASTSGWASITITSLVGFGFTLLQQLASGLTAVVAFSMFGRTARAAWDRLDRRLGSEPAGWGQMSIVARTLFVFGLGTTAVVLLETITSGDPRRGRLRGVVVQSASLCALAVGIIAAVAAGLAEVGRRVERLRHTTDVILRVLSNPLLWIGLVVVVFGVQALQNWRVRRQNNEARDV